MRFLCIAITCAMICHLPVAAADASTPAVAATAEAAPAHAALPDWLDALERDAVPDQASPLLVALSHLQADRPSLAYAAWKRVFDSGGSLAALDELLRLAHETDAQADLLAFLEHIPDNPVAPPPAVDAEIRRQALRLALWLHDLKAVERHAGTDGSIRLWARITGAFAAPAPMDAQRAESIEQHPAESSYTDDRGRQVPLLTDIITDREGWLPLGRHLEDDETGPRYAQALLESPTDREAVLCVMMPSWVTRIWLNGDLVYRDDLYRGYRRERHERRIRLRQGVNHLMVKIPSYAAPLELRIFSTAGHAMTDLTALPWSKGVDAVRPCKPSEGIVFSRPMESVWNAPDRGMEAFVSPVKWEEARESGVLECMALEKAGAIQEARAAWNALTEAYPQSHVARLWSAAFRLREARRGVDSKIRLEKEALALLREALALRPTQPHTNRMLGEYFDQRDQPDEALPFFRTAFEHRHAGDAAQGDTPSPDDDALHGLQSALALARHESGRGWTELASSRIEHYPPVRSVAFMRLGLLQAMNKTAEAEALRETLLALGEDTWDDMFYLLLGQRRWDACEQLVRDNLALYPEVATIVADRHIDLAEAQGRLAEACELLRRKSASLPTGDIGALTRIGTLQLEMENREAAIDAFAEAARLSLERYGAVDENLMRRLRDLRGESWINGEYDVALADVAHEDWVAARFPSADHARILEVVVHRVFPDRSVETLRHIALRPFTASGIDDLGEISLPEDSDNLMYCHTILPDGTVYTPTNIQQLSASNAASMYRVTPGCILESAWREFSEGGWDGTFEDSMFFEQIQEPVRFARFVLIIPEALAGFASARLRPIGSVTPQITRRNGDIVAVWECENVIPAEPEPGMPDTEDTLRNLVFRLEGAEFSGTGFLDPIYPDLDTSPQIAELARKVTDGATTAAEKLNRIHAWIRTNLKPLDGTQTPRDVLALGGYDARTSIRFLRAMLDAAGSPAQEGRANTQLAAHVSDGMDRASQSGQYWTPVLLIPEEPGRECWFSPLPQFRYHLPAENANNLFGARALVQDDMGLARFMHVHGSVTGDDPLRTEAQITLREDGSARVEGRVVGTGPLAGMLRRITEDPQQSRRVIESLALSAFPGLKLDTSAFPEEPVIEEPLDRKAFVYTFSGTLAAWGTGTKGYRMGQLFSQPMRLIQQLLAPEKRTFDFVVGEDMDEAQEVTLTLPEGWRFRDLPSCASWTADNGHFRIQILVEGRTLKASRMLSVPAARIPAERYPALAAFAGECRKSDTFTLTAVALTPAEAELATPVRHRTALNTTDIRRFIMSWPLPGAPKGDTPAESPASEEDGNALW